MQNHQMAAEFFIKENQFKADRKCWQRRIMSYQDLTMLLSRSRNMSNLGMSISSPGFIYNRSASSRELTT